MRYTYYAWMFVDLITALGFIMMNIFPPGCNSDVFYGIQYIVYISRYFIIIWLIVWN